MILLFSGGLDSYIAWHYLDKPKTLYCAINHRYQIQEHKAVIDLIPETIVDSRLYLGDWEEDDANIPMRNAFFFMIASHYADKICLVVQKGEMSIPDRSPKFFSSFGAWLSWMRDKPIKIFTPFDEMTKTQMVRWYLEQGLNVADLLRTRSCFGDTTSPCGACAACFRRWVAFKNNGFSEPYINDILAYDQIPVYIEKMKALKYDELRTEETFTALKDAGYTID